MGETRSIADIDGHLLDHFSICEECDGYGEDDASDPLSDPCDACEGEGKVRWGCFYEADQATCETCEAAGRAEDVGVAALYDGGNGWVCLRCYVTHHAEECGCHRWIWAETLLGMPERDASGAGSAADKAFNAIAKLCGCPEWDYPGQIVRDVQLLADRLAVAERVRAAALAHRQAMETGCGCFVCLELDAIDEGRT